jgi:DNA helicase II / ATP-dependent DNA helicase PcrA
MQVQKQILKNLNDKQQQAVKSITGETLVIAGAGSGKTAVLTRRVAYLIALGEIPGKILCLTFTNKAAKEMNNRVHLLLSKVGIQLPEIPIWQIDYQSSPLLCTFHSLGVRILREFGSQIGLANQFNILDTQDQKKIISDILKQKNLDSKSLPTGLILNFISKCKQELLTSDKSKYLKTDYLPVFHQIYKEYEKYLKISGVIDFDDLLLLTYLLLKQNPETLAILKNRWTHILVDEFQDTNQTQFEIIKLLYTS